jgi:serine/threonine-protein kinase
MPLLSGEDLSAALERVRVLPPAVAVRITLQAARGLGAAHAAGVVHRDVKPSNLFLVDDGSGVLTVRVADFGLAKIPGGPDSLTSTGAFLGTPHYVSPEQATNAKSADARTDVWSLAMTLYHALTGAPAFARTSSFMALVLELTGNPVPSLQDAAPWVPPEIARVVHGALIRDPDLRCPSMGELELALQMGAGFDACAAPLRASEIAPAKDDAIAERAALPGSWEDLLRS